MKCNGVFYNKYIWIKHLVVFLLFFQSMLLNATEIITGTIGTDINKCDDIESTGSTIIQSGQDITIISNKSVILNSGFQASALNGSSLLIYLDQEDCCPCNGSITDPRDNNTYETKRIEDQVWMTENFAYNAPGSWVLDRNGIDYGRQYHFSEYMNNYFVEGSQGICPSGWHIPTIEEFLVLLEPYSDQSAAYDALKNNGSSGFDALEHDYAWFYCNSTGRLFFEYLSNTVFGSSSVLPDDDYRYSLGVFKKDLEGNLMEKAGWISQHNCLESSVRCIKDCSRSYRESAQKSTSGEKALSVINNSSEKAEVISELNVYPNPSDGHFTADLVNNIGATHIEIYDVNGQKIYQLTTEDSSIEIDLSKYGKGVYIISAMNESNYNVNRVIIK